MKKNFDLYFEKKIRESIKIKKKLDNKNLKKKYLKQ